MELGDGFEVVLGPGVMDRPGSEAVGIGAEAEVKISELFAELFGDQALLQHNGLGNAHLTQRRYFLLQNH